MNHTVQTFDPKLDPRSPTCEKLILNRSCNQPSTTKLCGSWKSRVFAEVMECKNAIKSKASKWGSKLFTGSRSTPVVSNIPDIVTFSVIAKNEEILIEPSLRVTQETQKMNTSIQLDNKSNSTDELVNRFLGEHSTNEAPKLFLEHEKGELPGEGVTSSTVKRKISVHPLLLHCLENADEFDWFNDTNDSFCSKPWDSPEHSNVSDIVLEDPQNNSTFHESLY